MINDVYGSVKADKILIKLSDVFKKYENLDNDIFGRITADEFVVLFNYINEEEMNNKIDRISKELDDSFLNIIPEKVPLRAGRYLITNPQEDIYSIFEKVNFAHSYAKQNNIVLCNYNDDIKQIAIRSKDIENKMDAGSKNEEFKVFLQPKYLLKDETIGGAEAFVRWINNGKTVSTPNIFIPIFEQTRFILKFDMYMFENVCKLIRTWIDENKKLVTVSVNFSRLHFANKNFVNDLCSIADKYSAPHNLLEIEITESAVISNISALEEILNELHKQNFTFSIDDFGTGYSSLGMLKDISVDVIKIDKSFFDKCESDERARMVIDSVMKMTKRLKICTVAEGIEEKVYIDFLKKIGCDMVQGFYYSKPIPAEEFTKTKI